MLQLSVTDSSCYYKEVISRCSKLTRFITKAVLDRSLSEIKQALDDLPKAHDEADKEYQDGCRKLLLKWRKSLRRERDKLMDED